MMLLDELVKYNPRLYKEISYKHNFIKYIFEKINVIKDDNERLKKIIQLTMMTYIYINYLFIELKDIIKELEPEYYKLIEELFTKLDKYNRKLSNYNSADLKFSYDPNKNIDIYNIKEVFYELKKMLDQDTWPVTVEDGDYVDNMILYNNQALYILFNRYFEDKLFITQAEVRAQARAKVLEQKKARAEQNPRPQRTARAEFPSPL